MVLCVMLDYQLIEAFAVVLDEGGFAHAAEKLCITQSAVSQRVKQLEENIGRALIIRESPPRPTEAGAQLLRHYRQVTALETETIDTLGVKSASNRLHLQIAVNTDSMAVWFMDAIAPFVRRTGMTMEVFVGGHEQTIDLLRTGVVAGCVSSERKPISGCTNTLIGTLRYALVASASFADRWFPHGFTREAAMSAPIVNLDRNDYFQYRILYHAFGEPQLVPPAHYIPTAEQYFQAVSLGMAYGLVPVIKVASALADGSLIELDPHSASGLTLYWHCWQYQSALLSELSETVVTEGARLLES